MHNEGRTVVHISKTYFTFRYKIMEKPIIVNLRLMSFSSHARKFLITFSFLVLKGLVWSCVTTSYATVSISIAWSPYVMIYILGSDRLGIVSKYRVPELKIFVVFFP